MASLIFAVSLFLLAYVTFVFVLSPLIFPHLWHVHAASHIPSDMAAVLASLSAANPDSVAFVRALFDLLKNRYTIEQWQTHTSPWILFRTNIDQIWNHVGSNQTCTVLNFVLKTALVHSGRFKESDIIDRRTIFHLNMHQYLLIQTPTGTIAADPYGYLAGYTDVGEYCTGFGKKGTPVKITQTT